MGGPVFMGLLTIIFIAMLAVAGINGFLLFNEKISGETAVRKIGYIKSVGLFGLVVGVLGQLIGLYSAFQAIEIVQDISPSMLAGGLKVSMITTLYGLMIFIISYLIWLGLSLKLK